MQNLDIYRYTVSILFIGIGGSIGAVLRYLIELQLTSSLFPTLLTNISGSFILGLLLFDSRAGDVLSKRIRLIFGVGFCSSFTTYSTFILDTVTSEPIISIIYIFVSYIMGFGAILLSYWVVEEFSEGDIGSPGSDDS